MHTINFTDKEADTTFQSLVEQAKTAGWHNFIIHHMREDGACESYIHGNQTESIKSPIISLTGTMLESMIITHMEITGEEHPGMGSPEYKAWLFGKIKSLVGAVLVSRND